MSQVGFLWERVGQMITMQTKHNQRKKNEQFISE
jgi:hypothetical protein